MIDFSKKDTLQKTDKCAETAPCHLITRAKRSSSIQDEWQIVCLCRMPYISLF